VISMARFDERDPRWIVEEREDGTNVKNWHWTEKDCTAWSKSRLTELLLNCPLSEEASVFVQTTGLQSLKGEAFINNRKNKLYTSFELNVKIGYSGKVRDGDGVIIGDDEGVIEVPNLSDEQEPEDWEFRITPAGNDAAAQRIKSAILGSGRVKLRSVLSIYVDELKAGVPINKSTADVTEAQPVKAAAQKKAPEMQRDDRTTQAGYHELRLEERYHANPQDIFDCFTIAGKLQAFTQSPAKVDASVGGEFSWFDGAVSGRFVELDPPTKLVLDWRFSNWTENHFSKVTLVLKNPESGLTVLSLHQIKIPEEDSYGHGNVLEVTESGWRNQILTRIKAVFGYGI